jgi:DNA-binding transcriptional regulator YhcF (GntR family)
MTVAVTLDMLSATPPYEQVRSQIAGHIRTGSIRPGEKLPVVRALAADLGVATNTVARAYRELEAGGLVTTPGGGSARSSRHRRRRPARPCSCRPRRSSGTPAMPGSPTRRSSTSCAGP